MKKLLLLMVAVCLVGCESSSIRNGRKAYKEYFYETLKDPESLRIYKEKIVYEGEREVKFEVEIGAKNSYGAYVRDTYYFHIIGDKIFKVNDELYFDEDTKSKTQSERIPVIENSEPIPPAKKLPIKYKLSEYKQYISSSDIEADFAVGEVLILKVPILAAKDGAWYDFLRQDIKTDDKEDFNEFFHKEYYKLLPKGTKVKIEEIFNEIPPMANGEYKDCVNCLKVKVITGKYKGENLFIGKFLQK